MAHSGRVMEADALGLADMALIAAAFMLGGFVKGLIGVALPMLAMAILTIEVSVPLAVSLVVLPTLVANIYQGVRPSEFGAAMRRFWPLLLAVVPGIGIGTGLLASLSSQALLGFMGVSVLAVVALQIAHPERAIPRQFERWTTPVVGMFSGIVGGVVGLYGPPMAVYMASLRMHKDAFIASISLANCAASLPLAVFLYFRGIAEPAVIATSIGAMAPMFAGLIAGQRLRGRIDAQLFNRLLQIALIVAGLNFLRGAIVG
ncbi:MAG: sulfite exporter TauE/SafE family protein [Rhizobiales bacterium]|nr:sulfite exporter TauE/SafE family protein [Hyphomicrobiales bacterium]